MTTLREVREQINTDQKNWRIYLMDFVDDFRYYKDPLAVSELFCFSRRQMGCVVSFDGGSSMR